jgi:WD40 repeat protein
MAKLPPVKCPQCQKKYRLPASFDNRQVVCKRCQHQFLVQSGVAVSNPTSNVNGDGDVSSPFESLDIDVLLNSPTSGLEKSKLRSKRRSTTKRPRKAAPQSPAPTQAKADLDSRGQQASTDQAADMQTNDPDPKLIEKELEFAWAKKKTKQIAADEQTATAESHRANSNSSTGNGHAELDEEELAIYRAVTRQNRRRNFIWATIAAVVVILIGGYFGQQEYQRLSKPLSPAERDWLTQRGFVLEANHIANAGRAGDGAAVILAAGKSFADVDKFRPAINGHQEDLNPNDKRNRLDGRFDRRFEGGRGFGASPRRNKRRSDPRPEVDFDTNVDVSKLTTAPVGSAQQIPFAGYAVGTFSPRGHAYVAGSKFIKGVSGEGEVFDQLSLKPNQTVTAMTATPDGRYLIAGDDSGVVEAYRIDDKGRLSRLWKLRHVHHEKIIHLRSTKDSQKLVVYSADGRLTIWKLGAQSIERNLSDLVPDVRLSSFQLTDEAILIGSSEGLRVVRFGQSEVDVVGFDKRYRLLAADRAGENIVVADSDQINGLDAGSKRMKWRKSIRIADEARVEFAPDGESAFYYDGGKDVLHFEVNSGQVLGRYGDDRLKFVRRVSVSFDGRRLLACGNDGAVLIYSIRDAKRVTMPELKPPLAPPERVYPPSVASDTDEIKAIASVRITDEKVSAVCLSDNGFLIAAERGRTTVYDWPAERIVYERFESGQDKITTMVTIGSNLVIGRSSGMVQVSAIEPDGKLGSFRNVSGHIDPVKFIVPVPQTALVATVTESGHTRVWDLTEAEKNEAVYVGKPVDSSVNSVVVDRRSDLLLAAGDVLATLDYKSGDVKQKKGAVRVRNVTLLPDGKRLAFFDRSKLNFATTSRGEINLSIPLPKGATSVSFPPNSKLAFLFADEKVIVYRLRGGKEIFSFPIGFGSIAATEMVFSADNKFMLPWHGGGKGGFRIYATPSP